MTEFLTCEFLRGQHLKFISGVKLVMDRKYKVDIDSDKENDEEKNNEDDDIFDTIPFENTSRKLVCLSITRYDATASLSRRQFDFARHYL